MRKLNTAMAAAWALTLAAAGGTTAWAQSTQPATKPTAAARSPSADQMLNRLLSSRGPQARPLQPTGPSESDKTSGAGAVAPGAATLSLIREGSYIVDRVGRLSRGGDGQSWEFTFEADGKAMGDPPMVILPNQKLMLMENQIKSVSRELRFRVTGSVTEYRGRNYILLEKVVVLPETEQPLN